ncbi:MAG TPA: hypothetical protein DCL21_02125 [Alphaproteobacteria bacterium]|nr:hypothetical protein [Alphaproteobacteria bacterium]
MHSYLKIFAILSLTAFSTACTKQLKLKQPSPAQEIEEEFQESDLDILESANIPYELTDIKNPEKFVKYYLRSKFSLYNSDTLNEIAENNYKLALENPNDFEAQEQAFLLLLANQNYAKAINIINANKHSEQLTFENLFSYARAIAQDNTKKSEVILDNLLQTQNRLPHLKILKAYFKYQKTSDIQTLKEDILTINSSLSLDGFKYYYIGRAYEAKKEYVTAFKFYSLAFFQHTLRTEDVFSRLMYTSTKIDKKYRKNLFASNAKYGNNIYLVDQAFIDTTLIPELNNSLKELSSQVFYDLGWSINQTSANLAGLDFLALADYIAPNDKIKFQMAKGMYANSWPDDSVDLLEAIKPGSQYYLSSRIVLADMLKSIAPEKAVDVVLELKQNSRFNKHYLDSVLGQIYLNNNQFDKAITSLTSALEKDKSSKIYFSRAVAYERTNKFEKALTDLETALNKNPKNPIVLNYLGYLLIDLNKDAEKGLDYIRQSVKLDPTSAASLDSLGWAYIKLKAYEEGLETLETAYAQDSQDGVITGHLGDAYFYNGRKKEAIIYWKKALELEKDDTREINRIKQQLYKYNN